MEGFPTAEVERRGTVTAMDAANDLPVDTHVRGLGGGELHILHRHVSAPSPAQP